MNERTFSAQTGRDNTMVYFEDGSKYYDRGGDAILRHLFPEEIRERRENRLRNAKNLGEKIRVFLGGAEKLPIDYQVLTAVNDHDVESSSRTTTEITHGMNEFYKDGNRVIDVGCGPATGLIELAKKFPKVQFLGIDRGLGTDFPFPEHIPENLKLVQGDWEKDLAQYGQFDAITSPEGILRWGNTDEAMDQLTRIAKPGTILRGTEVKPVYGTPNPSERLALRGWEVTTFGRLVIAEFKAKPQEKSGETA